MRHPSSASQLYAWHRAALLGHAPPIHDGLPECGWYRTRLVRGGPWVAVEIRIVRDVDFDTGELTCPEKFIAIVDGDRRRAEPLWTYLEPISREEHADLLTRCESIPAMAATHARLDLSLQPMRP